MTRLKSACKKLDELSLTKGTNAKRQFVSGNKEDNDFLQLLKYRLNPYYTYKQSKFAEYRMLEPTTTFNDITGLLNDLRDNNINDGYRARTLKVLSHCEADVVRIIEGVITKTLVLGISSGVNKALGYSLIPEFSCMLAAPMGVKEIKFPVILELKLDGVRCIARCKDGVCTLLTRQGRTMNFPHLEKEVLRFAKGEDLTLDGELITTKRTDISGIVNQNLKKGYVKDIDLGIKYSVFDILPTDTFDNHGETDVQSERTLELQKRFADFKPTLLQPVPSSIVTNAKTLAAVNDGYIAKGEEGTIVKVMNATYKYKRSLMWRKLKQENSTTLKVVGVTSGKTNGKREGKVGAFVCEPSDGLLRVNVGSGLSDDEIDNATLDSPIGKFVEVKFNVLIKGDDSETYSLFLPRFESGAIFRVDKTEADSIAKIKAEHIGAMQI